MLNEKIFRAYDVRGFVEEISEDVVRSIARAVIAKTKAKKVIVGHDTRKNSPELAMVAIRAVIDVGADAVDIGMCSSSMFNFSVASQPEIEAGIMITASHNPANYNGVKMLYHTGMPISGDEILKIIKSGEGDKFEKARNGKVVKQNMVDKYLDYCFARSSIDSAFKNIKIAVDYGNGVGSISISPMLARLGVEVTELYKEPDANFPNHDANPSKEETLVDLKNAVRELGADLGIALDGDADRVIFVDNNGESLRGDLLTALIAEDILKNNAGAKIVVSPNQSWFVYDMIKENGGEIVEAPVGRTKIISAMKETGAVFGGEVSGHHFFKEFSDLESVDYAILKVLEIWRASGLTFANWVLPARALANSGEINISEIEDKNSVIRRVHEHFVSSADVINKLDGIRMEFDRDWWFCLRPSNTEPLIRLILEAKDAPTLEQRREELVKLIGGKVL